MEKLGNGSGRSPRHDWIEQNGPKRAQEPKRAGAACVL